MKAADVFELVGISDPALDSSGATVAYVVTSPDREANDYLGTLWVAAVDGLSPPRRLIAPERRTGSPTWSPDGTQIAFVSRRGGDEAAQLYVLPVAGGEAAEATRLTGLAEDVGEPVWSPDGTRIAFAARVRDAAYEVEEEARRPPRRLTRLGYKHDNVGWTFDRPRQLFVVAADGSGEPVQLTHGESDCEGPAWSPEGERIAFATNGGGDDWDIAQVIDVFTVAADGGDPERLTSGDGTCAAPAWSPQGDRIAYRWAPDANDSPRHAQIAVLDVATRERRVLTAALDRNCGPYPPIGTTVWDGDRIVFAVEDRGNTHVYAVAADGSAPAEPLVGGELSVTGYAAAAGVVVHVSSHATTMRELFRGEQRLTGVGDRFAAERELVEPERFTAVSTDGAEVDAWLVRPAGFDPARRYPLLLSIHGGPFAQYPTGFFDEFQVLAGGGYAVVYANPRGSSGYSEEWGRAICGPLGDLGPGWGSVDEEDLTAVVDEALRRFAFLDAERLGVLGGSYGGFMTSWLISHTNRFKAACSERALNHLLSAFGSSDYCWLLNREFGGWPWDDPGAWLDRSPATYAERIETPLLILHSENDLRCPVEQGEHLFAALRLRRKPVEFVRFPGESHELSRSGSPAHRVMRFEIVLDWFDRYLK